MATELELTHHSIDLAAYGYGEDRNRQPSDMIPRRQGETWMVPFSPLRFDKPVDWRHVKREGQVFIPMFPYRMGPDPEESLGFMLQIGLRCAFDFGRPVARFHLATGHPVQDVFDDTTQQRYWLYWCGLGVVLEKGS